MDRTARERLAFYVDPDVRGLLHRQPWGYKGPFINQAIRRYVHPPYTFSVPGSPQEATNSDFLACATQEIIATGLSLRGFVEQTGELLAQKITEHVPVTTLTISPNLAQNSPLYRMLLQRMGAREFVETVMHESEQSVAFFRKLRDLGRGTGTPVRIFTCTEMPAVGLLIRDRNRAGAAMRVHFYPEMRIGALHPRLDIDAVTDEGEQAFNIFFDYFSGLLGRSDEVS